MDEKAVAVRGGRHCPYRAVDRHGKPVASLLCNDRSMETAQTFLRAAPEQDGVPGPEKINVDGNSTTDRGSRMLAALANEPIDVVYITVPVKFARIGQSAIGRTE